MSTDQTSLPDSIGSSIPIGAEAIRYNTSNNHRPASSRKLFENGSRNHSEACDVPQELVLPVDDNCNESDDFWEIDRKNSIMTSEKISAHVNQMFSKLSENMDRICAIYGDGSLFSRSSLPFDAELDELSKLSETDARDQLERYALRCHISEREKEQLHKRNRELNDAVEILRTQVVRGQCDIVNNARVLAKQATDALRALEQTSTAEITKLKQKHALSLAQSSTLQNQLKHTAANLEAKKEELKEINKNYDMLRFERDSLRNHTDYLEQELEQVKNRVHDLVEELKMKEDALKVNREKVNAQDSQICALKEKLKKVESDAKEHVRRRENEITQQMDHYLQETKSIDAERERLAKLKIIEMQQRLKQLEEQKEAAERRAQVAEEKVADYKNNFVHYRGQMEGEAIRAITNGYRNALSIIPSSRKETGLSFDKLFPLKPRSYSENVEPSEDSFKKPSGSHCSRPSSKSESLSTRAESYSKRKTIDQ